MRVGGWVPLQVCLVVSYVIRMNGLNECPNFSNRERNDIALFVRLYIDLFFVCSLFAAVL